MSLEKKNKNVKSVLRYIALVALALCFAVFSALYFAAEKTVEVFTNKATYSRILDDTGLWSSAVSRMSVENMAPRAVLNIIKKLNIDGSLIIESLNSEIKTAIEKAREDIAEEIPKFVRGEIAHLDVSVDLTGFKKLAMDAAVKHAPGGVIGIAFARQAIETAVPGKWLLAQLLGPLEAMLIPFRNIVHTIHEWNAYLCALALVALALIPIVAFQVKRALIWLSIGFASAGAVGIAISFMISVLLNSMLPAPMVDAKLGAMFAAFFAGYTHMALACFIAGLVAASFIVILSRLRTGNNP